MFVIKSSRPSTSEGVQVKKTSSVFAAAAGAALLDSSALPVQPHPALKRSVFSHLKPAALKAPPRQQQHNVLSSSDASIDPSDEWHRPPGALVALPPGVCESSYWDPRTLLQCVQQNNEQWQTENNLAAGQKILAAIAGVSLEELNSTAVHNNNSKAVENDEQALDSSAAALPSDNTVQEARTSQSTEPDAVALNAEEEPRVEKPILLRVTLEVHSAVISDDGEPHVNLQLHVEHEQ